MAYDSERERRYIDYLVELAAKNPTTGIVEEPRAYYDVIEILADSRPAYSTPGVFQNGERFPVVLTHMTAFVRPTFDESPPAGFNEEAIQKIAMRIQWDDTFYQSSLFVDLPSWANVVNTDNPTLSRANVAFQLERPLILPSRDSLDIRVALEDPTVDGARRVALALEGTGLLSQRPYLFSASRDLTNTNVAQLDPEQFRNGGSEPVALTDLVAQVGAEAEDPIGRGDIRYGAVNIRVIGNGTQADFFQGPAVPALTLPYMPMALLGKTVGRAVCHRFPGDGLRVEPGNSFQVQLQGLDSSVTGLDVALALHGTLFVT